MKVEIKFSDDLGVWEDVVMPLEACDSTDAACMSFPILFSAPPDKDWANRLPYSWEVGSAKFSIERAQNLTEKSLLMAAQNDDIAMTYRYEPGRGIVSFRLGDLEEDRWSLCAGHLTFERLESWRASRFIDGEGD